MMFFLKNILPYLLGFLLCFLFNNREDIYFNLKRFSFKNFFDLKRISEKAFGKPLKVDIAENAYFNQQCHVNAIHHALKENKKNKEKCGLYLSNYVTVCVCFPYFGQKKPIVHFINNYNNDCYMDNTFGALCNHSTYYKVITEVPDIIIEKKIPHYFKKFGFWYGNLYKLNFIEKMYFLWKLN